MSNAVAEALQFTTLIRNVFGMCPYFIQTKNRQPKDFVRITFWSKYVLLLGHFTTMAFFLGVVVVVQTAQSNSDISVFDEKLFGPDTAASQSITAVVLLMSLFFNLVTYTFSVLFTFFKRHSWLRLIRQTLLTFDKLDKDYGVKCDAFHLKISSNGLVCGAIFFHCIMCYTFASYLDGDRSYILKTAVYFIETVSSTLSTFDLISAMNLLREIFDMMRSKIGREKYNGELVMSYFDTLDLVDDISGCQGTRECLNVGNQLFIILSQLFVIGCQIQSSGGSSVNAPVVFGILGIIPRVVNLTVLAVYGSLLRDSVGGI